MPRLDELLHLHRLVLIEYGSVDGCDGGKMHQPIIAQYWHQLDVLLNFSQLVRIRPAPFNSRYSRSCGGILGPNFAGNYRRATEDTGLLELSVLGSLPL